MEIKSVYDSSFKKYGRVLEGYDFTELFDVLEGLKVPEEGILYIVSVPELEKCGVYKQICEEGYGGMPVQLGFCSGTNNQLNCLEYHKSSEFNISKDDIVLILGLVYDIEDGEYDTAKTELFHVSAGTGVELYGTTLHYAPIGFRGNSFQVVCALPKGTNEGGPDLTDAKTTESKWCLGRNKWLLVHSESKEAKEGAHIGLKGKNVIYHD